MAFAVPVGAGDRVTIRMPSAVERRTHHLAEGEPALEIVRSNGAVEVQGAGLTEVVFIPTDPRAGEGTSADKRRRMVSDVRRVIAAGGLRCGDRLPSVDQFVTRYGASRATVRRALAELHELGLVGLDIVAGVLVVR